MTILALVNAKKEGQIESKIMRERQLEEVREARRKEAEKRKDGKREALEGKMKEVKRKRKGGLENKNEDLADSNTRDAARGTRGAPSEKKQKSKKRVSFA